jgi:predicted nucleotidyltransferase
MQITLINHEIVNFCKRHSIRKLSLFGSVLRDDFNDNSDVDFLVEFQEMPGFLNLSRMEDELSEIIGRKADIRTLQDLSRYFRDEVLKTATVQYVEG